MAEPKFPRGFVNLAEVDPTIIISPRYATEVNFVGHLIDGYDAPLVILTREAAEALKKVQERVHKDGYSLVIYDGYRPQCAVDHFFRWSQSQDAEDRKMKEWFYPRVNKEDLFDLGYIARRSGHSRGSTVDLTLIEQGKSLHPIGLEQRTMADGKTMLPFLDDGTVDMGTSFDLFDEASHYEDEGTPDKNKLIHPEYQQRRKYLKDVMAEGRFRNYKPEWWHFTLENEPWPYYGENSLSEMAQWGKIVSGSK